MHYALVIQNRGSSGSNKSLCRYSQAIHADHSDKDSKGRADATALKKNIENFNFVVCIRIWEIILTSLHLTRIYLRLFVFCQQQMVHCNTCVILEIVFCCLRSKKQFHDEFSSDCRLTDPALAFKVDVFNSLVDVPTKQLGWRFEGQRQVAQLFGFLFPNTMLKLSDAQLESRAKNLHMAYSADLEEDLVSEVRAFEHSAASSVRKSRTVNQ